MSEENVDLDRMRERFKALIKEQFSDLLGEHLHLLDEPEGLRRLPGLMA